MNCQFAMMIWLFTVATAVTVSTASANEVSDKPKYCWLYFGTEGQQRVLVRLSGERLTLEHFDGDGKATGRKDEFEKQSQCQNIAIRNAESKVTYVIKTLHDGGASVEIRGPVTFRQYNDLVLSESQASAPIAHFDGPLTIEPHTVNWELPAGISLRKGDKPTVLRAFVGTMDKNKECWVVVESMQGNAPAFPPGVYPTVEIEFPPKTAAEKSIKKVYPLDKICCGCIFRGPIQVPAEAGDGDAKVTYSFNSWKGRSVAETTIELPVHTEGANFIGEWQNTDQNSRGPTKLRITKAEKGWKIAAWRTYGGKESDLGEVNLSLIGDSVFSSMMRYGLATWSDETTNEHVNLRLVDDRLVYEQFVILKAETEEANNYRTVFEFKRAEPVK